jgi:hypothetical protein
VTILCTWALLRSCDFRLSSLEDVAEELGVGGVGVLVHLGSAVLNTRLQTTAATAADVITVATRMG